MKTSATEVLIIGAAFGGGFFAGNFRIGDQTYGLIVAPKADGDHKAAPWNKSMKRVDGALSYCDGMANTEAMAAAGSALAKWARGLTITDQTDWYLPSRDELEIIYRNLKPGAAENYCSFRDGDNPSSVPVGYPYTEASPGQTDVEAFRTGGAEALEEEWYWTSTQSASGSYYAWDQVFFSGYQYGSRMSYACRARAVRRINI
jgi:hypothetical protein